MLPAQRDRTSAKADKSRGKHRSLGFISFFYGLTFPFSCISRGDVSHRHRASRECREMDGVPAAQPCSGFV